MLRVARRIATTRLAKGLTQEALALRLDIATKNLQRVESGRQNLTLRTLEAVAAALGVDAEELLSRTPAAHADEALAGFANAGVALIPADAAPPKGAVPVYTLAAAAAHLAGAAAERLAWAVVPGRGAAGTGRRFLARATGHAMEPLVPDGAWCLFDADLSGPIEGRVALVHHRDLRAPEADGPYTLRRIGAVEVTPDGVAVRLDAADAHRRPLRVRIGALDELRAIAAFVRVVAPREPAARGKARRRTRR